MTPRTTITTAILCGILSLGTLAPANAGINITFNNDQNRYDKSNYDRGDCKEIYQVVRYGTRYDLKRYGKACREYRSRNHRFNAKYRRGHHDRDINFRLISQDNHSRRIGNALYYWHRGRLIEFSEPRYDRGRNALNKRYHGRRNRDRDRKKR